MNMKKIQVLMSTFNGEKFLDEQLESIMAQDGVKISVLVRDDGSSDGTQEILNKWQENRKLTFYTGDNLRPAKSFMNLIEQAPDVDYYALADQDDVWENDKLKCAVSYLEQSDKAIPALYFSQTQLVDENLQPLPTPQLLPSCTFYEGLIAHYATGCTFVFNRALLELVRQYKPSYISMHDLWLYNLCLAVGGNIYFDPMPHIKYRQHGNNVIGLSGGWKRSFLLRCQRTLNKECERSNTVLELYKGYKEQIKPEYLPLVRHIVNYRNSVIDLLRLIFNRKLRCSNVKTNLSMRIALLLHTY